MRQAYSAEAREALEKDVERHAVHRSFQSVEIALRNRCPNPRRPGENLEDGLRSGSPPIRTIDDAVARIRAAREAARAAGVPIVINARIDVYIKNIGDEQSRFDEAVARGRAYLAAGADCVYPITLRDPATIGRLVQALKAPVNINVRAGYPSVAELEALGIARVTTATQLTLVALAATRQVAREIKTTGRFDAIDPAIGHPEMQQLMAPRQGR